MITIQKCSTLVYNVAVSYMFVAVTEGPLIVTYLIRYRFTKKMQVGKKIYSVIKSTVK